VAELDGADAVRDRGPDDAVGEGRGSGALRHAGKAIRVRGTLTRASGVRLSSPTAQL
jgi:hypothetical protein